MCFYTSNKTSQIYTHISTKNRQETKSTFDDLWKTNTIFAYRILMPIYQACTADLDVLYKF